MNTKVDRLKFLKEKTIMTLWVGITDTREEEKGFVTAAVYFFDELTPERNKHGRAFCTNEKNHEIHEE
jgi:hypothetical protein